METLFFVKKIRYGLASLLVYSNMNPEQAKTDLAPLVHQDIGRPGTITNEWLFDQTFKPRKSDRFEDCFIYQLYC